MWFITHTPQLQDRITTIITLPTFANQQDWDRNIMKIYLVVHYFQLCLILPITALSSEDQKLIWFEKIEEVAK